MATETTTPVDRPAFLPRIGYAAVAGIAGGIALGVLMQFQLNNMTAVGALYTLGERSTTVGWFAHLAHSILFGAVFGVFGGSKYLQNRIGTLPGIVVSGALYATILWLVNVVVIWPLWLNAVALSSAPSFPYLAPMPLIGHLIYGLILGGGYATINRTFESDVDSA